MHAYDAHGPPYFISSSGIIQFREACYTVVSYAPYILLQIYTITILATFRVTIFDFFHPGPQPITVRTPDDARSPTLWYLGLENEILMLIAYTQKPPVNVHAAYLVGI